MNSSKPNYEHVHLLSVVLAPKTGAPATLLQSCFSAPFTGRKKKPGSTNKWNRWWIRHGAAASVVALLRLQWRIGVVELQSSMLPPLLFPSLACPSARGCRRERIWLWQLHSSGNSPSADWFPPGTCGHTSVRSPCLRGARRLHPIVLAPKFTT